MTKEQLGELILSSEAQLYATAKSILTDEQDCGDAIQEAIVKAFSKIHTLKKDEYAKAWRMRIPVILYYMEDFSIREIAQIMEISEGAVQKRLARARKKLKAEVDLKEVTA